MLLNEHIKPAMQMNQRYKYTLAQIYVEKLAENYIC